MKMRKTWLLIITMLFLGALVAIAGSRNGWFSNNIKHKPVQLDAKDELKRICDRFLVTDTQLNLIGEIRLFDNGDTTQVKEENSFQYIKNADGWYARLGQLQTFFDGTVAVQMDTVNKYITVSKVDGKQTGQLGGLQASINVLFTDTAGIKITAITGEGSDRYLSLQVLENPGIKSYQICYDANTYRLKSAKIEWWKDVDMADEAAERQVWTTLLTYHYHPDTGFNVKMEMEKVLAFRHGRTELQELYKDYQLHIATPQ